MAKGRRPSNEPLKMYENYVRKTATMGEAYNISAKYRIADFETGFKNLKYVQDMFKQYLAKALEDAVKSGASPEDLPYTDQTKIAMLKVFVSWLKYSNEKLGGVQIANNVAGTATMSLTEDLYGTRTSCEEVGALINAIFNMWVGVEPFDFHEEQGACLVTPVASLPPVPVQTATGFSVPLKEIVSAKTPEEIITGTGGGA